MSRRLVVGILLIVGCAGTALKNEMRNTRGYTEAEVTAIMEQAQIYKSRLLVGELESNAFNTAPKQAAEANLVTVWCNCWKRLKEKCRQMPAELSSEDHSLWLKANAIEMVFADRQIVVNEKYVRKMDGDECL